MYAQINGVAVHYKDEGKDHPEADPMILIHGFPFDSKMWNSQIESLKESRRVIAYDIRGLGKTTDPSNGQHTLEFLVDDLIALLDYLKIPRAVLCGFSMGGYIVLRAMERNPERASALVLCDTGPQADSNEAKLRRGASVKVVKTKGVPTFAENFLHAVFAPESFQTITDKIEEIRRGINATSETGICGALLAMVSRTDTAESLTSIKVPTLILAGEFDKTVPIELSQMMHEKIKGSEFHLIKNAAHMSNLENAQEFNQYLKTFLERELAD